MGGGGRSQAWESTQLACSLGPQFTVYLLILSGAQNWVDHTPQFLAHYIIVGPCESLFFFVLFCFFPFITHPWSNTPSHIGTHSCVFNVCPSNSPFMCLFTYMCICEKYMVLLCFNLHKRYCTINLVLFLFSLNILFSRDPALLLYVDLIHSSGPSSTSITCFLSIPLVMGP